MSQPTFYKKGIFLIQFSFGDCNSFVDTNQISDRSVGPGTIWDAKHKISDPNIMFKEGVISLHRSALHRGAFCQFPFRWIYYCHSSKSTGEETGKTHLCGNLCIFKHLMTRAVVSVWLWGFYIGGLKVNLLTKITFRNVR